jgi:hypothetical protein
MAGPVSMPPARDIEPAEIPRKIPRKITWKIKDLPDIKEAGKALSKRKGIGQWKSSDRYAESSQTRKRLCCDPAAWNSEVHGTAVF